MRWSKARPWPVPRGMGRRVSADARSSAAARSARSALACRRSCAACCSVVADGEEDRAAPRRGRRRSVVAVAQSKCGMALTVAATALACRDRRLAGWGRGSGSEFAVQTFWRHGGVVPPCPYCGAPNRRSTTQARRRRPRPLALLDLRAQPTTRTRLARPAACRSAPTSYACAMRRCARECAHGGLSLRLNATRASPSSCRQLHVESELDDVAVGHHVVLAFDARPCRAPSPRASSPRPSSRRTRQPRL